MSNNFDINLARMIMGEFGVGPEDAINMSFDPQYQQMLAGPMAGQFAGQQDQEAMDYARKFAPQQPAGLFQQDGGCLERGGVVINGRCVLPGQRKPTPPAIVPPLNLKF